MIVDLSYRNTRLRAELSYFTTYLSFLTKIHFASSCVKLPTNTLDCIINIILLNHRHFDPSLSFIFYIYIKAIISHVFNAECVILNVSTITQQNY